MDPGENVPTEAENGQETPLFDNNGRELPAGGDSEVSRLNTKIAALETKLDVLTSSMERMQAQKAQPVIEAQPNPQASLAAPVEGGQEVEEQPQTTQISAAPAKPTQLPATIKETEDTGSASGVEKEFRAGMQLLESNRHLEAASRFALVAKKFPHHLLAGHALYWAGEASLRAQQWSLAAENWAELESRYPRSAYMPEALAGLAKAHDALGDARKAGAYRSLLLKAFPKSPVALRAEPAKSNPQAARSVQSAAPSLATSDEEIAPPFTEENASDENAETQ
jgi:TolA-binding protein